MSKKKINTLLILAIAAPLVAVIIISCLPAIWRGIVAVAQVVVPNFWVILAYAYVGFIFYLIGLKKGKKQAANNE